MNLIYAQYCYKIYNSQFNQQSHLMQDQQNNNKQQKQIFSLPTGSLFGNLNKAPEGQQSKSQPAQGIFGGAKLFNPHAPQAKGSSGGSNRPSLFGSSTPNAPLFGGISGTSNIFGSGGLFGNQNKPSQGSIFDKKSDTAKLFSNQPSNQNSIFGKSLEKNQNQGQVGLGKNQNIFGGKKQQQKAFPSINNQKMNQIFSGNTIFGKKDETNNKSQNKPIFFNSNASNNQAQNSKPSIFGKKQIQGAPKTTGLFGGFTNLPNKQPQTQSKKNETLPQIDKGNQAPKQTLNLQTNSNNPKQQQKSEVSKIFNNSQPQVSLAKQQKKPLLNIQINNNQESKKQQQKNNQLFKANNILSNNKKDQPVILSQQQKGSKGISLFNNQDKKLQNKTQQGTKIKLFGNEEKNVLNINNTSNPKDLFGMGQTNTANNLFNNAFIKDQLQKITNTKQQVQQKNITQQQKDKQKQGQKISTLQSYPKNNQNETSAKEQTTKEADQTPNPKKSQFLVSKGSINLNQIEQINQQSQSDKAVQAPKLNLFTSVNMSKPPLPFTNKGFTPLKQTTQKNIHQKQKDQSRDQKRRRTPTFDQKSQLFSSMNPSIPDQNKGSKSLHNKKLFDAEKYLALNQLAQYLSYKQDKIIHENRQMIQNSFRKYVSILQIDQNNVVYSPIAFEEQINANQGVNRLINDFTNVISKLFRIPLENYKAFGQLFYSMVKDIKYDEKLFIGKQLNQQFVSKFRLYSPSFNGQLIFNYQQKVSVELICQFIKYYSSLLIRCLRRMQMEQTIKIMKDTQIYELFLEKSLLLNIRQPTVENQTIIQQIKISDEKQLLYLNKILNILNNSWLLNHSRVQLISQQKIIQLIPLVDILPVCSSTKNYQKLILKKFDFNKISSIGKNFIKKIQSTKSQLFMPFRVILHRLDKSKKQLVPFHKTLLQQIDGPQWADWLSLYLGQDNIRLQQNQMKYLIKALKNMQIRDIDKIVNKKSQINRLIHIMSQQNQIKNLYETLCTLIYDQNSLKKVEQQFLVQERTLNDDLRPLINQIRKFPNCEFNQQDFPENYGKSLYFLTSLIVYPQKALQYQNALFDIMGFIDDESQRCDRVCHLVLDILAYFSVEQFNEEIVSKSFEAIISLLETNSTKECMSLAMNVNRPQFQFFNKNLPKFVVQKIFYFLIRLVQSKQFYDSTRETDGSLPIQKAYPFRYDIEKYLDIKQGTNVHIPLYWFSNCLKMTAKQGYNPQMIQMILSKLKIYPSRETSTQVPLILSSIVDTCNNSNFYKQFSKILQGSIVYSQNKFTIKNKFLNQEADANANLVVFYSLKLLRTILELRKIRNKSQKNSPRHFVSQILSSLHCLNETDRQYLHAQAQIELFSTKNLSPIISLIALIFQQSKPINMSAFIKTEWLYNQEINMNIEDLKKLHNKNSQCIDYSILREPLIHPLNKNLECYQNIQSVAFECLCQILNESQQISIQTLLYMTIPKENRNLIDDFNFIKQKTIERFIKALQSPLVTLNRCSWRLLVIMRKNKNNRKLAQEIFKTYYNKQKLQIDKIANSVDLVYFLCQQIKDGSLTYSDLIQDILNMMSNRKIQILTQYLQIYKQKSVHVPTLHQYQRLVIQKNMLVISEFYETISLMCQIILLQLYNHASLVTRHSSLLFKIIAQSKIINICSQRQIQMVDQKIEQQICELDNPRLYGLDILQLYITKSNYSREQLLQTQVCNVTRWFNSKILEMNRKINTFLSIILSIDETYYGNHPIKLKSKIKSQLFCQHHMGVLGYKSQDLIGHSQKECIISAKMLIDCCLQKIQRLRHLNQFYYSQLNRTYATIDLLVNWLRSFKFTKKLQLNFYCKKVMSVCFIKLGESVLDPVSAKLLLSCIKILHHQLNQDIIVNLKETIFKTIESSSVQNSDIKHQLISLFVLIPPQSTQTRKLQKIVHLWCTQQVDEYFYSLSRVVYKLCQLYPIEMSKLKLLSKCDRVLKYQDSALQGLRYEKNVRTAQNKYWIWILKIASTLMENGRQSILVVHQVQKFVRNNRKRIRYTLNEAKDNLTLKNKLKQYFLMLSLAQLDQLQATLQLFIVLSQSKMWIEMNRQLFEQLLYYLIHKTKIIFAPSSMGQKLIKIYKQNSLNQKLMAQINTNVDLSLQLYASESVDKLQFQTQQISEIDRNYKRPNAFRMAMSFRFNQCLKLWLLSCSTGMRSSCFVRQYFTKPIPTDSAGVILKYSLNHWDHFNQAISDIIKDLIKRVTNWGKWQDRNELLNLINDCFSSAEMFTETGYFYSIIRFAQNRDQLISQLGQSLAFALEMGACHLVSQIFFRTKNGTFSKQNLQSFQQKLLGLNSLAEQQLLYNKVNREDEVFKHIKAAHQLIAQIKL